MNTSINRSITFVTQPIYFFPISLRFLIILFIFYSASIFSPPEVCTFLWLRKLIKMKMLSVGVCVLPYGIWFFEIFTFFTSWTPLLNNIIIVVCLVQYHVNFNWLSPKTDKKEWRFVLWTFLSPSIESMLSIESVFFSCETSFRRNIII